jgi:hypothetical protein
MKYLRYQISFLFLFLAAWVYPQHTGEWLGAEVEFDLPKKFTLETSIEARALNTGSVQVYKYFAQFGLNYKIHKRFDVAFKYRLTWRLEENMHYYYRNKMMLDLKSDYPIGRFQLDYRARFQRLTKTYINSEFDPVPRLHFRNKLELSYNIPKTPIEPRIYGEVFLPLYAYKISHIDEYRAGAKVKFPIKKKHSVTGGVMYVQEKSEMLAGIIFMLSYKYTVD